MTVSVSTVGSPLGRQTDQRTNGLPSLPLVLSLQHATTYNNNNNTSNSTYARGAAGERDGSPFVRKSVRKPKPRTPRPTAPHPCRICAEPVLADGADTALHPECKVDAPRCASCGRSPAIPDPHCGACGGTGTIGASACPWCRPGPCPTCVMATLIATVRQDRQRHERIGPCPGCDHLAALPLGPLCADCVAREAAERDAWEATW
jgi:hypothetical protein